MIRDALRRWAIYQITDLAATRIESRWGERDSAFFINSAAGLIKYKPKTELALTKFRDAYINTVETLASTAASGKDVTAELFILYREIMKNERVSYTANLHTRVKGRLVCFFGR